MKSGKDVLVQFLEVLIMLPQISQDHRRSYHLGLRRKARAVDDDLEHLNRQQAFRHLEVNIIVEAQTHHVLKGS